MKIKNLPLAAALAIATLFVVGCGDRDDGLSAADRAWVKQQRINQMYGIGTTTNTTTVTSTVTITNSTTVVVQ